MNLYAICPEYAPGVEVTLTLAESESEALEHAGVVLRQDNRDGYDSPTAAVYLVAEDVKHLGDVPAAGVIA